MARIEHLLRRYGSLIRELLDLSRTSRGWAAAAGADDYLRAEIVYAASHEGARHLDDVLARRTHVRSRRPTAGCRPLAEIGRP